MKRVLSLMIVAILVTTSTVYAQSGVDTIVNKGDGKVVIIDQRPKTVINRPAAKPANNEPVVIKLEQTQPITYAYYYPEPSRDAEKYSTVNWLTTILSVGLLAWFVIWLLQRGDKCNCGCSQCNHNQPAAPIVNHFHVSGGTSVIDGSENLSNYQHEHHYHKHTHMPMFPFMGNQRASETVTGAKDTEVKS